VPATLEQLDGADRAALLERVRSMVERIVGTIDLPGVGRQLSTAAR